MAKTEMRPIGDRVIVKPIEVIGEEVRGGIVIPEHTREKPTQGKVIAVGPKVEGIAVGDEVAYGKYSGSPWSLDDTEYVVLRASDVLMVLAIVTSGEETL